MLTLSYIYSISLVFCAFNLLPIYPFDGFMVYSALTKKRGKVYNFLRTKAIYVIYALFILSFIARIFNIYYLDILGIIISFISGILGYPINLFWGLIL